MHRDRRLFLRNIPHHLKRLTVDLALSPTTHDLAVGPFDLALTDGLDAIAQRLRIRLRFFLGEWFLNIEAGLPFYQEILAKGTTRSRVEALLKSEILGTPGVTGLESFALSYDGFSRTATVTFSAKTTAGTLTINQEL